MTPQPNTHSELADPERAPLERPIVYRSSPSNLCGLVVLSGLLMVGPLAVAFVPPDPNHNPPWLGPLIACILGIPAAALLWFGLRSRIVADAQGLTFLSFCKRRFVPWAAVEDYELRYLTAESFAAKRSVAFIQVDGQWLELWNWLLPYDGLLRLIQQQASASRAISWQRDDEREAYPWPQSFGYRDYSLRRLALNVLIPVVIFSACFFWMDGFLGLLALFCLDLVIPFWSAYDGIRNRKAFLDQNIVATKEGLRLIKTDGEVFMRWDEIQRYGYARRVRSSRIYEVVSPAGRIEYIDSLQNKSKFKLLVQSRAVNSQSKSWYEQGAFYDVVGGEASLWPSGQPGTGDKLHHYRIRSVRAVALGSYLIACIVIAIPFLFPRTSDDPPLASGTVPTALAAFAIVSVIFATAVLCYRVSGVQCEADGLRSRTLWGRKHLLWRDVERFELRSLGYVVAGRGITIRFRSSIADKAGLVAEIERSTGRELQRRV